MNVLYIVLLVFFVVAAPTFMYIAAKAGRARREAKDRPSRDQEASHGGTP